MKIICAGFPKTGTKSLALALRQLGYTVHDFPEHCQYGLDTYLDFLQGRAGPETFLPLYAEVDAVVDQPACTLWSVLLTQFPEAKVILTERDSCEAWAESYQAMLVYFRDKIRPWYHLLLPWLSASHSKLEQLASHNMVFSTASTSMHNPSVCLPVWKGQYEKHNAAVKAMVPPDRLIVLKVGEGWERLCTFLEKPIPASPWPHENRAGAAGNIAEQYVDFEIYRQGNREALLSLLFLLTGATASAAMAWSYWVN